MSINLSFDMFASLGATFLVYVGALVRLGGQRCLRRGGLLSFP